MAWWICIPLMLSAIWGTGHSQSKYKSVYFELHLNNVLVCIGGTAEHVDCINEIQQFQFESSDEGLTLETSANGVLHIHINISLI